MLAGKIALFAPLDTDAAAYIYAVEAADGQGLEAGVRQAINAFVVGCKADGIWSAIKASCILMGARTLTGALKPLVGSAPTNYNFVSGDYSRKTGLIGNATTKYLDSGRNNNADPQNSNHNAVYLTAGPTLTAFRVYIGSNGIAVNGANNLYCNTGGLVFAASRVTSSSTTGTSGNQSGSVGLIGHSRNSSTTMTLRVDAQDYTGTITSTTPSNENVLVYARTASSPTFYSDARMSFYSIGEYLSLSLLDSRLGTLYTAIGNAIP